MCDPRQLFFQCGPETPKGWTTLLRTSVSSEQMIYLNNLLSLLSVPALPPHQLENSTRAEILSVLSTATSPAPRTVPGE